MSMNGGSKQPTFTKYSVKENCVPFEMSDGYSCSSMTMSFKNETTKEVRIKDRFGVNQILHPAEAAKPGGYVDIFLKWRMTGEAFKDTCRDFRNRYNMGSPVTASLLRCWYRGEQESGYMRSMRTYEMHLEIMVDDIQDAGGTIYLEELDLLICLHGDAKKAEEHPFSPTSRFRKGLASEIPHIGEETFIMSIRAVDNNSLRERHDRFLKIGDMVYHVPIERDERYCDGVFITSRVPADEKNALGRVHVVKERFLSFEEADKLFQMYDTIEQAREGLSTEELRKEEIQRRLYEQKIADLERQNEKLEREHTHWREKASFEREFNEDKEERQRRRSNEENVRDQTRSFTEWMKLVAGVISAAVAFAATCAKLKPS